jgi:hypothetical protein
MEEEENMDIKKKEKEQFSQHQNKQTNEIIHIL